MAREARNTPTRNPGFAPAGRHARAHLNRRVNSTASGSLHTRTLVVQHNPRSRYLPSAAAPAAATVAAYSSAPQTLQDFKSPLPGPAAGPCAGEGGRAASCSTLRWKRARVGRWPTLMSVTPESRTAWGTTAVGSSDVFHIIQGIMIKMRCVRMIKDAKRNPSCKLW